MSVFNGKLPEKILCIAFEELYRMLRLKSSENAETNYSNSRPVKYRFYHYLTDLILFTLLQPYLYDGNRIMRTLRFSPIELSNKRSSSESYGWADAMTSSSSTLELQTSNCGQISGQKVAAIRTACCRVYHSTEE